MIAAAEVGGRAARTAPDSDHAHGVAHARRALGGETGDAADAEERGGEQRHLRGAGEAGGVGSHVAAQHGGAGHEVELVVLGGVALALEHVEHAHLETEANARGCVRV